MNFNQPPPEMSGGTQMVQPPVNFNMPPPGIPRSGGMQGSFSSYKGNSSNFVRHFQSNFIKLPTGLPMTQDDFDGKRLRKSVMRKTVDYNSAIIKELQVK